MGFVVDTSDVWWEPGVLDQIDRAAGRVAGGMVGDGHTDFATPSAPGDQSLATTVRRHVEPSLTPGVTA